MRKLILIAALVFTGACASTPPPEGEAKTGWTQTEYNAAFRSFFNGYGTPDAFGHCGFNYMTDRYTADGFISTVERDGMQGIIDDATLACQHLL